MHNFAYMKWKEFIKQLCYDFRLSENQLATKTGITQTTINRISLGETDKPYPFTIDKLEKGLNIIIDYSDPNFRKSEKDVLVQRMKKIRPRLSFEEVNPVFWSELKTYLASLGNQPYTIHKAFGNLKAMVNNAIKLGLIPNTNLKQVTEKRPQTHREYLLKEELELLDRTPCRKPNVKNAFLFCCFTGLRFGDVKALTFASVQNNQIEIRQQKTGDYVYIPLSEQAKKYLPEFSGNLEEPLFGHLADGTVHAAIREWVATAGITKHVMFHTSRHTFATLALTYGVDIETVSSLLGHTSIRVTQIYAKIISKKKEEAINKLPTL